MWIEDITQSIAQEIESKYYQHDRRALYKTEPRCIIQVGTSHIYHQTPGGIRQLHADTKKAKRTLGKDGRRHIQCKQNDQGRKMG